MSAWALFFGWPYGGVWSNLVASVICGVIAFLWAHRKFKNLHKRLDRQDQMHAVTQQRIKAMHKKLDGEGL